MGEESLVFGDNGIYGGIPSREAIRNRIGDYSRINGLVANFFFADNELKLKGS